MQVQMLLVSLQLQCLQLVLDLAPYKKTLQHHIEINNDCTAIGVNLE